MQQLARNSKASAPHLSDRRPGIDRVFPELVPSMQAMRPMATLEPVRFGEFLRDRNLISDEQWLAALADHWSNPRRRRIGNTIVDAGFLPSSIVESEARVFHDDLDVIEVVDVARERSEKTTIPLPL
jgi:hypothetical protein